MSSNLNWGKYGQSCVIFSRQYKNYDVVTQTVLQDTESVIFFFFEKVLYGQVNKTCNIHWYRTVN